MPLRSRAPRTTHQWLKPLYNYLDQAIVSVTPSGASGIPNGVWIGPGVPYTQLGNATGLVGFYGSTGIAGKLATGTAGITAWTGAGASAGLLWFNGGTGTFVTIGDMVVALKNVGILPP